MPGIYYSGHRLGVVVMVTAVMLFANTSFLHADDTNEGAQLQAEDSLENADVETLPVETERYGIARAGYRFLSPDGNGFAATPYMKLVPGPMFGLSAGTIGANLKLSAAATIINKDDYRGELLFDGGGAYRLRLESQALWHNLLQEQLPPEMPGYMKTRNLSPGSEYGLRFSSHGADAKIRLGKNPLHLTLGYWELHREGNIQTRFSDFSFSGTGNSLLSMVSKKDQTTREGTLGLDGQFGSLGVAYTFRIRDFSDHSPLNSYNFSNTAGGSSLPGSQLFSVTPDNQSSSHTIKLYSDMSGGLTGTTSYTYMQRENNGGASDAHPSSVPRDTIQVASGDLRYTPFKEFSFTLKYRRHQINRESPETITTPFASIPNIGVIPATMTSTSGLLLVHPSVDSVRDTLIVSTTYQPRSTSQVRLEYRAELESRSDLQSKQTPDDPALRASDSRQTHTGKITALWKPLNGIKLTALYSYADCDNPAYSSSFSRQHTGQLFATLNRSKRWGATASYLGRYETTDNSVGVAATNAKIVLPRENFNNSLNASIWFAPMNRLTITTSYSYLVNDSDQAVLFNSRFAESLAATNYKAVAHLYSVDAVYAVSEQIDLGASFQQTRSNSRFAVGENQFTDTGTNTFYTTAGITDITAVDATETGVSVRGDWRITQKYGFSMEYGFRMYNSGNSMFDGTAHSIMTLVTGHW